MSHEYGCGWTAGGALLRASAALAVLLLAGCGTGTTATGRWTEPRMAVGPYKHMLIVAVSANSRVRRSFEQQLADAIGSGGTKATESVFVASDLRVSALNRDTITAMVEKSGADAVLVGQLINRTVKAGKTNEQVVVKDQPAETAIGDPGLTQIWGVDYTPSAMPSQTVAKSDAHLEAVVYDVASGGKAVYKIDIDAKFQEMTGDSIPDIVGDITNAIVGELRSDRLIK